MNRLVALALTFGVGASGIGCSASGTPTAPQSSTISTTAAPNLVDVAAVWQTEPLPDCPKPPIVFNGAVPPGLSLPDKASVARELRGVKSPASEGWVRTKLGWVTQELASTRADIISDPSSAGAPAESERFSQYVGHVKAELEAGHDIPDSELDGRFPEGCA
ncbi:Uncharacterised protein [Mycobacteroides abscessus]|nr:hypothetical protein MABM_31770 [Mycobacteroides abscessus]CPW62213.1 Uncharacterised protein [Mycobacteroides abscessus]